MGSNTDIGASTSSTGGHGGTEKTVETMKDIEGEEFDSLGFDSTGARLHTTLNFWSSSQNVGTYFGIGNNNTPATENDYALSGSYVNFTDYTMSNKAIANPVMVNGKAQLVFSVTFTAKNDITVGEIGLIKNLPQSTTSSAKNPNYLLGRVALATPIELSAGESATFQVTIEI